MLDINAYTGKNIADRLDGIEKECYLAAWDWMEYAWGDNVEFQRMSSHILLCDETRAHLLHVKEICHTCGIVILAVICCSSCTL